MNRFFSFMCKFISGAPLAALLFTFTMSGLSARGQDDDFPMLEPEKFIHFRYELSQEHMLFFFYQIPEEMAFRRMVVTNLRTSCSSTLEINESLMLNRQATLDLCQDSRISDTFTISVLEDYMGICYVPQKIISGVTPNEIKLGENCYRVICEPENDPWMPSAERPFLFSKNDYYLNPTNGRILKGKRAVESGLYSGCDLEYWILIDPDATYTNKSNVKFKGADLIKRKRIKVKEWQF